VIRATLLMAIREIRRNLMRSGLTMLGVVIGVAAVVALVSIGRAATAQVTASISSLGNNMLTISPGALRRTAGGASATPFELDDVDAVEREIRGLVAVAPTAGRSTIIVFGNKNWRCSVNGTTNAYLKVRNYKVVSGREFTEEDERTSKSVCLIGATTKNELFGKQDPVGQLLRVGKMPCDVIGTLGSKGEGGAGTDQDDVVLMPLSAYQRKISGNHDVSNVYVSVEEGRPTSMVKAQLEGLMRERRRIAPGAADDFSVRDMQEVASAMVGATSALTGLLGAIAGVSLLVGGIGIMNIMLVSVSERTREIGTRLAIGAIGTEVLAQFLVEAVMLSTCGGMIGAGLGVAGSAIASKALDMPFVFVPEIVMLAFVFSATIGVVFGYLPARQAARLNPIEALRHE